MPEHNDDSFPRLVADVTYVEFDDFDDTDTWDGGKDPSWRFVVVCGMIVVMVLTLVCFPLIAVFMN